jgi:hypothetical protein
MTWRQKNTLFYPFKIIHRSSSADHPMIGNWSDGEHWKLLASNCAATQQVITRLDALRFARREFRICAGRDAWNRTGETKRWNLQRTKHKGPLGIERAFVLRGA